MGLGESGRPLSKRDASLSCASDQSWLYLLKTLLLQCEQARRSNAGRHVEQPRVALVITDIALLEMCYSMTTAPHLLVRKDLMHFHWKQMPLPAFRDGKVSDAYEDQKLLQNFRAQINLERGVWSCCTMILLCQGSYSQLQQHGCVALRIRS